MTVAGGRVIASYTYPDRARRRAQSVASLGNTVAWVHRTGPQAERFLAGGPPPGTPYEEFDYTNPAGSDTR